MAILKIIAAVFAGIVILAAGVLVYILVALAMGGYEENDINTQ